MGENAHRICVYVNLCQIFGKITLPKILSSSLRIRSTYFFLAHQTNDLCLSDNVEKFFASQSPTSISWNSLQKSKAASRTWVSSQSSRFFLSSKPVIFLSYCF